MYQIDPWAGYNQGQQNLANTFKDMADEPARRRAQQLQEGLLQQRLEAGQLENEDRRRQLSDSLALRTKLQNAQPTYTETVATVPNPAAATYDKFQQAAMTGPPTADEAGPLGELVEPTLPTAAQVQAEYPAPAPTIQQTTRTETPPNYYKLVMEHAKQTGNIELLQKTGDEIFKQAEKIGTTTGNPAESIRFINESTGSNLKYLGSKGDFQVIKLDNGNIAFVDNMKLKSGMNPQQATTTIQTGGNNQQFLAALSALPDNAGAKEIYGIAAALGVKMEDANKAVDNRRQEQGNEFATFARSIRQQIPGATDADIITAWRSDQLKKAQAQRQVIVSNPMPSRMNINYNGLSPEENTALQNALNNGLDPYKVNSKTAKIYAQQELLQPGRRWNELGAQASFERSQPTMQTKALLNTIDPLLTKLEKAGAILGNSSIPGYNRAANFLKEQTGQPDIVGFNNLRDDVIAEVERGLLGTGVLSDSKYNRAIKNVNSAQSMEQLKAAIANTRTVIQARLEALKEGPFPNARSGSSTIPRTSGRFSVQEVP